MNSFIKCLAEPYCRLPVLMLITLWAISGCSESSNSVSTDDQQSNISSSVSNSDDGVSGAVAGEASDAVEVDTSNDTTTIEMDQLTDAQPPVNEQVPVDADTIEMDQLPDAQPPVSVQDPVDADESIADTNPSGGDVLLPVQASLEIIPTKTFRINWQPSTNAEFYRVLENPDGVSGFSPVSENLAASTQFFDHRVALFNRINALYIVQACNTSGCVDSDPLMVTGSLDSAIGYFKASNTDGNDKFGGAISLSADGTTLAVGASSEQGGVNGINGDGADNSVALAGAVYVFVRSNGLWQQQAYLKASDTGNFDLFGNSLSLSADGNTLAVGAFGEDSIVLGINGDATDNSTVQSGATYVFTRSNGLWQQQAYLKASNTDQGDFFGVSVSLNADGNTLAVGASLEDSGATGSNGNQADNSVILAGAVYVFVRSNGLWQQQAYLKASNSNLGDTFGASVSVSADGNTLAVGASNEGSGSTGINSGEADNSADRSGAVYVFVRTNGFWQQQAYIKASNTDSQDFFGGSVSVSADGNTLAVGASSEDSSATGINGPQDNNTAELSGAVYVFVRNARVWQQQAYIKASNANSLDQFGTSARLSADGNTLAVGAGRESSAATGINGDENDNSAVESGAVYVFVRSDGLWNQSAYLKASNTDAIDFFGIAVALDENGSTLAIGASTEDNEVTGINGDQSGNGATDSGAVYLY